MKNNVLMIANPSSGGYLNSKIREFVRILQARGYDVETFLTNCAGDATSRANTVDKNVGAIVVAGGDGTLNEVINGLEDPSQIPLVLLPMGTSNVMAQELGLPSDVQAVAQALEQGRVRRVDMGLIGSRRFVLFVGAGFDGLFTWEIFRRRPTCISPPTDGTGVTEELKQKGGGLVRYWHYVRPVLRALVRYHAPDLWVSVDGKAKIKGQMVLVSNVRNYGGTLVMADRASCDSGHLDVCLLSKSTFPALARYYLGAFRSRVSKIKGVHYLTGKKIQIESESPAQLQVDGDYYGTIPVLIDLQPACVPIVVPSIASEHGR